MPKVFTNTNTVVDISCTITTAWKGWFLLQAFSHFTYQHTQGRMIVVDIQGVDDTYTDPQIHSNIPQNAPPVWGQVCCSATGCEDWLQWRSGSLR